VIFVAFVFGLWISFILLSRVNTKNVWGPLAASCLRWACGIMEITSLRFKVDQRDEETWLTALDQSMGMPTKKVNKYSLFQYSILQIILIALTGIALVIVGVRLSRQRWVWLLGITLLAELAIRLVVEVVWRKLRLGGILQRWLKRLAEKVNGFLLNID